MLIDEYYQNNCSPIGIDLDFYYQEIAKAENRLSSTGFLEGKVTVGEQLYNIRNEMPTKEFLGIVLDYDRASGVATIEQRNYFEVEDEVEFFGPNLGNTRFKVMKMMDEDGNELMVARHPLQIIKMKVPFKVNKFDMVRRV